jgi:ribosomal subunit interface protein
MNILISGRHVDVGEALHAHIEKRLGDHIPKYLDRVTSVNVVVTKEAHLFRVDIHGNTGTSSGIVIKSSATAGEVYSCFDAASAKIEKQLRRYKRRLTNHHKSAQDSGATPPVAEARKYVLKSEEENDTHDAPLVIAEKVTSIETMSVSEAVMRMDLADLPALLFFNAQTHQINLVYRRADGNISWVDPQLAAKAA